MAKIHALDDMFLDLLKDVYYAEKQILKALPKMAKAARSTQLKAAFEKHRDETEGHVERLEQVFEIVGQTPRGKTCDAILGIIEEGKAVIEDYDDSPALDAGLVAAAQAVEHYEIARYGTLKAWANQLGKSDAAKLFGATLAEEEKTDMALTKLAATSINKSATATAA
ncbi:ferritin-like domain-containing protein [Phreatobacter stygius]|uniref:Ferritin-like domain-containing protein n=1 Tax=Phreatobacter stygius TaxID=1940610 RepID=A0A4D7AU32_9HYPH|nr:ferritin-like domain-containing protein [Phreatobacter stygius]QCI63081.1 ferritin-like domain-containing protein [Phreatobacter stygius]